MSGLRKPPETLLRKGVEAWNRWRDVHSKERVEIDEVDLSGLNLFYADFSNCDLYRVDFTGAYLRGSSFADAGIHGVRFDGANLSGADFDSTVINSSLANLQTNCWQRTSFDEAVLGGCDFLRTRVSDATFRNASLAPGGSITHTMFVNVDFSGCDFEQTCIRSSQFDNVALGDARNLDKIYHEFPSTIGIDTLRLSRGLIPEAFLRGCGLTDFEIEMAQLWRHDLTHQQLNDILYRAFELRATRPLSMRNIFISYSHRDSAFVDALQAALDAAGIRSWRDIHDMQAGRMETQIDRAIRLNQVVILVLSQHSVSSDWVEWEASAARALEKELKRDILCPIALDDAWKTSDWPGPLRRQIENYHILDFRADFETQLKKLITGIGVHYAASVPLG